MKWSQIDVDQHLIRVFQPKTNRMKTIPMNETTYRTILALWHEKEGDLEIKEREKGFEPSTPTLAR
jgi:hypothetical protein